MCALASCCVGTPVNRYSQYKFYFECDGNPNPKVWIMQDLEHTMEVYPSFTDLLK
jgi:hypothetical protein